MFNFQDTTTKKTRDHTSRHMTDGEIDFTLIQYDAGTTSAESKAAGDGPCIHHFAIEVEDLEKATAEIKANGCVVVSDPGVIPVKFRAPGGTIAELVEIGRYQLDSGGNKINRITHISLKVEDIKTELTNFGFWFIWINWGYSFVNFHCFFVSFAYIH